MAHMERRSMRLFNDYPWSNNIAIGETALYIQQGSLLFCWDQNVLPISA